MKTTIVPIVLIVASLITAPIAVAQTAVVDQSFSTWPPAGWSLAGSGCGGWTSPDPASYPNYTGGTGAYAAANSDECGGAMDAQLLSPVFGLPDGATVADLSFNHDYYCGTFTGDQAAVEISADGGATWSRLAQYGGAPLRGPAAETIDLMAFVGSPNLQLRFHFTASGADWWWQVDDVRVTAVSCPAPPSPHVFGNATGCAESGVGLSTEQFATYQWLKDGAEIPGARGQTLTASSTGAYSVTVTNAQGCVATSAALSLTLSPSSPAPSIVIAGATGCSGGSAVLTASGGGPFQSYQWHLNGAVIPGATAQTYVAMTTGVYTLDGINAQGCPSSSPPESVSIAAPLTITGQPKSQTVAPGQSATLSVTVAGIGPFVYQWYLGLSGDTAGPIDGATASTLTTPPLTSGASYWVRVSSGSCDLDSNTATISVGKAFSVSATASPSAGTRPVWVLFRASASGGSAPYSYSWSFGDGSTGSGAMPWHLYISAGTYQAKVTATGSAPSSGQATAQVSVTVSEPLACKASASPTSGSAPLSVELIATPSGGVGPYACSWDFGDGAPKATGADVHHSYKGRGTYTATASTRDSGGATAKSSVKITVR